jgi:hypothetical protein
MRWMEFSALSGKSMKGMVWKLPRPFELHFEIENENFVKISTI